MLLDFVSKNPDIEIVAEHLDDKDISKKRSTAFRQKQEKGHYTTDSILYGYSKDPSDKIRLIINPETAPTVKRMFQIRFDGRGYSAVAYVATCVYGSYDCPEVWTFIRKFSRFC